MLRTRKTVNVHPVTAVVSQGTVTAIGTAVTGTFGTYRAAVTGDLVTIGSLVERQDLARALAALIAKATGVDIHLRATVLAAQVRIQTRGTSRSIPVRLGATVARTAMVIGTLPAAPTRVTT